VESDPVDAARRGCFNLGGATGCCAGGTMFFPIGGGVRKLRCNDWENGWSGAFLENPRGEGVIKKIPGGQKYLEVMGIDGCTRS